MVNVRMYDCGFGDCFRLSNNEKVLYVDFGIHRFSKSAAGYLATQYDKIIEDIPDECDFLLTHYHEDHYEGVIHMVNNSNKRFRNVYIPDIWSIKDNISAVELILLKGLFSKSVLKRGVSLYDFLISICRNNSRIHFVSRGTTIQDKKYVALWPSNDYAGERAKQIAGAIQVGQDVRRKIRTLSENLIKSMRHYQPDPDGEINNNLIGLLEEDRNTYYELSNLIGPNSRDYQKLSNYANDISIVFQNVQDSDKNILFTGDIPNKKKIWRLMENNIDSVIQMHSAYKIIKVPHHGTSASGYYHSFESLSNGQTVYLIPNGVIHHPAWQICENYSNDARTTGSMVICANNSACKSARGGCCNCSKRKLIYNNLYIDV